MKILIIGGMHGNEPLGIDIVERLTKQPIKNVTGVIANPEAKRQNKRFTGNDLNRSFPGSDESYEGTRAKELLELCKQFDLVLDFHNTNCPDNDCAFVGEGAGSFLTNASSFIGLKRIIVADYECINKYATNCVSVEISLDSPRNTAQEWLSIIKQLSTIKQFDEADDVTKYKFVYRITLEDADRLNLRDAWLEAFVPIKDELGLAMNVALPAYPIFINDAYTPYNFGGLLNLQNTK